ncbi:MAG TPA: choice-of-anchor L domain-containing protein [Bacteroidales bacterium]|nr:choice-of-anchor L domain-containing protein [Bacteroidales bacterium]
MKIKSLLIVFLAVLTTLGLVAQERKESIPNPETRSRSSLSVTPMSSGVTAQQMVETILGQGVTFSNVQYAGAEIASGLFSGGDIAGIGIDDGIILSSGAASNAIGPNDASGTSTSNGLPGDPDLNALGYSTYDASVLEFDFIPETNNLSFSFVMGSEEYPEYINSYPDVFAFFVNGVNIAFVPGTTIPISIGTINHEQNSEYYISNTPPVFDIQCDGFTVEFQLFATVTPNVVNHIKMAIADVNDYSLDTWIFLKSSSFVGVNLPPVAQGVPAVQPIELTVGEAYNLTVSFLSPEVDQITEAIVNTFGLSDFTYTVTPGNVCTVEMDLLATMDNIGLHEIDIIATDNGTPPESTTINLSFNINSLDPVINVDPLSLSESLYPDETSTQILTISNTGDADLVFDLDDLETSKSLRIKSVKKSSNGDSPDDFINYLNDQLKNGVANTREVSWLSETPLNGTIAPGEMMEIEVAFDATGLAVDVYNAQIIITSNDPDNPQIVVPVTLQVLGMNCIHITTDDNENNALQGVPDYDMDEYLFKDDPKAPIEFNIFVDEANIESAQLSIYAWDVDELQGEVDEVYINGNFLGALTGADDEWSTTIFNVDPAFLNPGPNGMNLIQIFIDVATNGDWAVNVDWGQLIINNCMGDHAFIRYVEVDKPFYLPGEPVVAEIEVDTDLPTQTVIVETNLLNPDMINIDGFSTTKVIQYEENEPFNVNFTLPVTAIMDDVFYVQVIVYDATTYLQQDLKIVPLLINDDFLVCMEPGWQLISSYIEPLNPSVEDIMSDLVSDDALVIMLSKLGFYWPSQNINYLTDWDLNSGYKVKLSKAGCLFIDGEETILKTVNLEEGFNYLPVLSSENVSASQIFEQIEDFMLYAFDIKLGLVYWPQGGLYTLTTLEPGNAYLVTMLQDGSVTYPVKSANPIVNNNQPIVIKNSPWKVTNTGTAHIISIFEAALTDLKQGDIIAAFNTEGVCVGITQVAGEAGNLPLVVYGNDLTTELVDGLIEGEAITLKVYDPLTQNVTEVYPVWDNKMPNNGQFAENGLSAIMTLKAGTSVSEPSLSNLSIYPNPNTGTFNVTGINQPVEIQVINTTGQVIERFYTDQSIEINLSNFAKGIYFLKVLSAEGIHIEKLIVR